ncbi:hypothetical protein Tco_0982841 [Tanacetum coccineum]
MVRSIIKEEVNTQLPQILPQAILDFTTPVIEKNITESLEAAVLTRSLSQPQSSYEAAATLSEFELTKILIDKMEKNKSFDIADYKRELYDALVKSYNTDKDIFESYGELSKEAEPSRDSRSKENKSSSTSKDASKSQHKSSSKSAHAEEPSHTVEDSGMQQDQEFIMGDNDEQPTDKEVTKADWFKKPERPPTPDPDWSKRQHVDFRPPKTWISQVSHADKSPTSFDKLNDTSFDFSIFVMNRLIPNLTQEILVGPTFNLLKGTCKSITELEYHFEECSKATTERLDWHNPKNKPYPFDLRKPLPLIQDHRGRQIIPKDYFINNDLEYLKSRDLSRRYSTSVTKIKAATYELKWIEDLVPELWSLVQLKYDQHAYFGTSHWGPKRQSFYGYASNLTSSKDVYSRRRIICEGDFKRLRLQDIEDMLLLLVQQKLTNLTINERQNRRDLPRDIPLDSVVVLRYEKRSKSENKGKVPTEMELVLEQTQQGTSYEVSVSAEGVEELKRKVKIKGEKKEALLTLRQKPGQYICCQESQR